MEPETLDLLATALEYPQPDTAIQARSAAERLATDHAELASALWALAVALEHYAPGEAEERYTTLFDLSPVCTLHIGYHLFGESYARGALLAGLSKEVREAGLAAGTELADHVPTVLRLIARLGREDRELLVDAVVLRASETMAGVLADSPQPWARVVKALPSLLRPLGAGRVFELPAVTAGGPESCTPLPAGCSSMGCAPLRAEVTAHA